MRHPPKLDYAGLTIIMSNPSRFDKKQLLSGTGGLLFCNDILYPQGINRFQCDIKTLDKPLDLLPNTKAILLLGQAALRSIGQIDTELNAQRGHLLYHKDTGLPMIASYLPQSCVDRKDSYETETNPFFKDRAAAEESCEGGTEEDSAISEKKRHGKTNRKNYGFWLSKDVEKCVNILNKGIPKDEPPINYIIYPDTSRIISVLRANRGSELYFDIETDTELNITCFSFSFGLPDVYIVPCVTHDYAKAYPNLANIFQALAIAIKHNTLIAHNGAGFDFIVLAHKYKIAVGHKLYDTMLAQNRIYPEAEKSLGHCISLPWMYEPYHKDEGNFAYGNQQQALELWKYCGKDVSTLIKLKKAQTDYANKHIGISDSISSVNSYIRSYLTCTIMGMHYDLQAREKIIKENDRLMMQYLRMIKILVGEKFIKKIRGNGKSSMPGSNKQCCHYFHELLKYPVIMKTPAGKPKLDKKAMFKLRLKINNPVIDIILAYRKCAKESGSLKFLPWKEAICE